MIDEARRAIEREARLRSGRITEQALLWRRLRGASFVTYVAAGIAAYFVLLASHQKLPSLEVPAYARLISAGGMVFRRDHPSHLPSSSIERPANRQNCTMDVAYN